MTDIPRYAVHLKPATERALRKIADHAARRRIVRAIDGLATTARPPPQAVRIQGSVGLLRIRTGGYRVVYTVEDASRTVIATIGHRREVYRR